MKIKNNYVRLFLIIAVLVIAGITVYFSFPAIIRLIGYIINLFLPFIIGYLYVCAVRPLARFLNSKMKLPHGLSAILTMFLSIGIVGGIISVVIMNVFDQVRNIYTQFPIIYAEIEESVINTKNQLSGLFDSLPLNIRIALQTMGSDITTKVSEFINKQSLPMISYAGATARALPKVFIGLIVFFLSSFFMLSEPDKFTGLFSQIIPEGLNTRWERVKEQLKIYFGAYVKAQGIIMLIAFVIIFAGLSIINVNYSLIIAIGVAVLDALPFFGSGAVLWPWAIIRFVNGDLKMGISLMVIYVIIVLTRQFIEPKIVSQKIGTNPLLTLMSMYIGYKTFSIGGMILGPITMMLIISFYKAGVFDGIISIFKIIKNAIKYEYNQIKEKLKGFGE